MRGPRRAFFARWGELAGSTGLEPAASGVTGRRSNQLNYDPAYLIVRLRHWVIVRLQLGHATANDPITQ